MSAKCRVRNAELRVATLRLYIAPQKLITPSVSLTLDSSPKGGAEYVAPQNFVGDGVLDVLPKISSKLGGRPMVAPTMN